MCRRYTCECIPDYYLRLKNGEPFASDLVTPRGTAEERAFFFAIGANPVDMTGRLVFADWLDEHSRSDEAALLRERGSSPVIAPFRVLPYWRAAPFYARLLKRRTLDSEMTILKKRLKSHDEAHGGDVCAESRGFTRMLMLTDEEAVQAGIDRWPLLQGEPEPIIRGNKLLEPPPESR